MRVIVFGATGTVGKLSVERMLKDGHHVTAFARNPGKLDIRDPRLSLVAGDAFSETEVSEAIEGHDAVVVTLGAGMSRSSRIRSLGTLNVIRGMHKHGVRRLICQSTLGAHESWSNLDFFWKRIMFGFLLKPVFKDHERQEDMVRASGLDWTIVRPSAFTDEPAKGGYVEDVRPGERKLTLKMPRADLANFLSRQISDTRYLYRAVGITN